MTDKLRELLEDVQTVYEGKGMVVHPNSFDKLRMEIIKLDNINRLQNEQIEKAKELLGDWLQIAHKNHAPRCYGFVKDTEQFLKESE